MRITVLTPSVIRVLRCLTRCIRVIQIPLSHLVLISNSIDVQDRTGDRSLLTIYDLGFTRTKLANQTHTIFIMNGHVTIKTYIYEICICKSRVYLNSSKT